MPDSRGAVDPWLPLVLPSLFVVHKYLGWEAAVAYPIVVAAVVALHPRWPARLSERTLYRLAVITFLLVVIALAFVYPIASTHAPARAATMITRSISARRRCSPVDFRTTTSRC